MTDKNAKVKDRDKNINSLAKRFAFSLVIRRLTSLLTWWLFLWGVVIIILRATSILTPYKYIWGIWVILFLIPLAYFLEYRSFPSISSLRALLDLRNNCGGLLMAEEKTDIHLWESHLPRILPPCVRWYNKRTFLYLAVSLFFVVSSAFIPIRHAISGKPHRLEIDNRVKEIESKIEVLKEETILGEDKAQELLENLKNLSEEASGDDPVKTWEALDHIDQVASETAKKSAEDAMIKAEEFAKASALSDALGKLQKEYLNTAMVSETMKEFGQLLESFGSLLGEKLPPGLLESSRNGTLSQEQMKELAEYFGKCKSDVLSKISRLCKEKLLDIKVLEECQNYSQYDSDALALLLAEECKKEGQCMKMDEMLACSKPGKGGINRGRADAPMTWSEMTKEENVKFKEEVLPQNFLNALGDSKLVGVSVTSPQVSEEIESKDVILSDTGEGGSAYSQIVLPRHKSTVKKYFERER